MRQSDIQSMHAALPLAEKMALIQRAVEVDYFGKETLPCCMPFDGGSIGSPRRWMSKDFAGQSVPALRCNQSGQPVKVTAADWLNFENSTSFSGEYLLAQALRHEVTRDESALAEAHRALTAIRAIAELPGAEHFGWLCKPFGGKASLESSPDQNVRAAAGLRQFLPYADKAQARWIREFIVAAPRYWERIDYTIDFGDDRWDLRGDVGHMRVFHAMAVLAQKSGGQGAMAALARRLSGRYGAYTPASASLFDTFTRHQPGYFDEWRVAGEFAGATLLFVPLTIHLLTAAQSGSRPDHVRTLARCLSHGLIGLDPAWYGHYYLHEVKRVPQKEQEYFWRPLERARADALSRYRAGGGRWMLFEYPHRLFWHDATARLPLAYMIYLSIGGRSLPNIARIVHEIMNRLDYARLHWMVDPHQDNTPEELRFATRALTSEAPMYLAAYWLGRRLNFW